MELIYKSGLHTHIYWKHLQDLDFLFSGSDMVDVLQIRMREEEYLYFLKLRGERCLVLDPRSVPNQLYGVPFIVQEYEYGY